MSCSKIQKKIITGKLPCSLDECTTLAAIQLRIEELELYSDREKPRKHDELKRHSVLDQNTDDNSNLLGYETFAGRKNIKKICYKSLCNCFYIGRRNLSNKKLFIAPSYYKLNNLMTLIKVRFI
jgi:hypothetical protein